MPRLLAGLMLLVAGASTARAAVLFENAGTTAGWSKVYAQRGGSVTQVTSPVYKGSSSLRTWQTYMTSDAANYHSETIKAMSQLADQDLYYGKAIYLPADWQFHNQNVTFQQFSPEMPEGPWMLMFVEGEKLRVGGRALSIVDLAPITNLRGTWIRIVTRIKMSTAGALEVWVNGTKVLSRMGDFRAVGPSLRWSNGIYCTRWDTEAPTGQRELAIFHDNLRIATTLEEADPASWGGDAMTSPDAGAVADAGGDRGMADAGPAEPDSGSPGTGGMNATGGMTGTGGMTATGGRSGTGGMTATGGRSGTGGAPATGGAGGSDEPDPDPPARKGRSSGGCAVGGSGEGGALVALALILLRRRRVRSGS